MGRAHQQAYAERSSSHHHQTPHVTHRLISCESASHERRAINENRRGFDATGVPLPQSPPPQGPMRGTQARVQCEPMSPQAPRGPTAEARPRGRRSRPRPPSKSAHSAKTVRKQKRELRRQPMVRSPTQRDVHRVPAETTSDLSQGHRQQQAPMSHPRQVRRRRTPQQGQRSNDLPASELPARLTAAPYPIRPPVARSGRREATTTRPFASANGFPPAQTRQSAHRPSRPR